MIYEASSMMGEAFFCLMGLVGLIGFIGLMVLWVVC